MCSVLQCQIYESLPPYQFDIKIYSLLLREALSCDLIFFTQIDRRTETWEQRYCAVKSRNA